MKSGSMIGLDWGTSSLRAFLMRDGRVIETRHSADGLQRIAGSGTAAFERAFAALAGDWLRDSPVLPVAACGMVGSAQGWREAPYVPCPADVKALAARGVRVAGAADARGPEILIAPGVLFDAPGGVPDVMRGEEMQVAGALLHDSAWSARSRIVLPGTHSKWVRVDEGRIVALATYLTGEMFALLKAHSILGRLMTAASDDPAAFTQGIERARSHPGDLLHHVFAARTLGVTGRMPHESLADYLSGVLIGHELVAALEQRDERPLVLVGEPALCERYAVALRHLGRPPEAVLGNTAPAGLWSFACAAGLVA